MSELTFFGLPDPWWPYLFIVLAGWLPTGMWRYIGVLSSGSISDDSTAIQLVRCIATALVAAVVARLVLYPTGSLALVPDAARIGGTIAGFLAYYFVGRSIVLGIVVAEAVLLGGAWWVGLL